MIICLKKIKWTTEETQEYMNYCHSKLTNLKRLKNMTSKYATFIMITVKYPTFHKEMFVKINNNQMIGDLLKTVCERFGVDSSCYELVYNYCTLDDNYLIDVIEFIEPLYLC